jgi:RNA polymerase sigma-70 factor (ECF subfamily)
MKPQTGLTDNDLIALSAKGNNAAFNTLILRHKNKIYTSIFLLVKNSNIAEDIFQDLFIKIIDSITAGKYNEEGKFLNWALRIAHNMCINHFRSLKRSPAMVTHDDRDTLLCIDSPGLSVEQKIVDAEISATLQSMLDKLTAEQREVIILRHYANLSFKEIATLTNCSINTALGRMRYGLTALKKMNKEYNIA